MSGAGYFIDTNVIIDFIKGTNTPIVKQLRELLTQDDIQLAINIIVLMEVLRVIPKSENKKFSDVRKIILVSFQLIDIDHDIILRSIDLNRLGRSQGITLKKENECGWLDYIHYATAEKYGLEIISNDRDMDKIKGMLQYFQM